MCSEKELKLLKKRLLTIKEAVANDHDKALRLLQAAGIITEYGELSSIYRS
jgi:hypothetical protein